MNVVGDVKTPEHFESKGHAKTWAKKELKRFGYHVDRQNFGIIYFNENDIDKGGEYADRQEERAALVLIPYVLKRGIEIDHHGNHKLRQKETITFAGPVIINGIRGNMAVVVNMRGNHYYAHRVVMPDGTVFKFSQKNKEVKQEAYRGGTNNSSLANTTSFTSNNSIYNGFENVNKDSLSNEADDIAPVGDFSTPLNELYYDDFAPIRSVIAPAKVATDTNVGGKQVGVVKDEITAPIRDDISPAVAENVITDAPIRE